MNEAAGYKIQCSTRPPENYKGETTKRERKHYEEND